MNERARRAARRPGALAGRRLSASACPRPRAAAAARTAAPSTRFPSRSARAPLGAPLPPPASPTAGRSRLAARCWRSPVCRTRPPARPSRWWSTPAARSPSWPARPAAERRRRIAASCEPLRRRLAAPMPPLRATFRDWDVIAAAALRRSATPTFLPRGVLGADLLARLLGRVSLRGALRRRAAPALCSSMTFWSHLGEDASLLEDAGLRGRQLHAVRRRRDHRRRRSRLPRPARPARRPADAGRAARPAPSRTPSRRPPARRRLSAAARLHQRPGRAQPGERRRPVADDRHRRRPAGPERVGLDARRRGRGRRSPRRRCLPLPTPPGRAPAALRGDLADADRRAALGDHPALRARQPRGGRPTTIPAPASSSGGRGAPRSSPTRTRSCHADRRRRRRSAALPATSIPTTRARRANSAAYLEIGGQIPVAVISDDEPVPAGAALRRPAGGARARRPGRRRRARRARGWSSTICRRRRARSSPARRTRPRRLLGGRPLPAAPGRIAKHFCFGLGPHGLPASCCPGRRRSGDRRLRRRCGGPTPPRRRTPDGHPMSARLQPIRWPAD